MQSRDRAPVQAGSSRRRLAALSVAGALVAALTTGCGAQVTPSPQATPIASAATATSAPSFAPTPTPSPAYADTLRIGWDTSDPFTGFRNTAAGCVPCGRPEITVGSVVNSALYRYDARWNAIPDLADGPCVPQGDGTVIRCHLIETTFQDGTPVTADDVAYTYQLGQRDWMVFTVSKSLKAVRVVDARTVDFVLASVDPTFLTSVLPVIPILPHHAVEASYAAFLAATKGVKAADLTKLADTIDKETGQDPPVCTTRLDATAALAKKIGVHVYREDASRTGTFDPCYYMWDASGYLRVAGEALGSTGLDAVAWAYWDLSIDQQPIGAGPYRFVSEGANLIHLEAWPGYHGGLAATRYLDFVPGKGDGSDVADGSLDIYQAGDNLNPAFKVAAASHGVRVATSLRNGYFALMFSGWPGGLFADVALRKALQLCIDLPRDVDAATGGTGTPVYGPVTPGTWASDPALPEPARDTAAARTLIEGAGWRLGPDGIYAKSGARLAADIVVRGDQADRVHMADLIASQARDCGMDLRSRPLSFDDIVNTMLNQYPHDIPGTKTPFALYIGGWGGDADPGSPDMLTSAGLANAKNPTGNNFVGFDDPTFDRLIKAAMSTYDQAERTSLYRQVQQELAAQLPYLFLWNWVNYDVVRSSLATVDGPIDPTLPFWAWQPERLVVAKSGT
jgi:ABC-type transport system substrate-binding protein